MLVFAVPDKLDMTYSIIIPSYNSETTIVRCLNAVTRQEFNGPYDVLVADSSTDATPELIRRDFPQVTLIRFPRKTVPGIARNAGILRAQGDILCFLDADCIPASDWLRRIAEAHTKGYAAVGGAVANANPESLIGWAGYFAEFREFFPFHAKQDMPNIPTCNISYKRWVFERYGGFPDPMPDSISHKHPQQEDLLFNLFLHRDGHRVLFDPAIRVAHTNMTSFGRFLSHEYRLGRSTSQLLRHYPDLQGHRIARSRMLTLLAAPLLPCVKFANTFRIALNSWEYTRFFLFSSPLLAIGLLWWVIGFVRGQSLLLNEQSHVSELTDPETFFQ